MFGRHAGDSGARVDLARRPQRGDPGVTRRQGLCQVLQIPCTRQIDAIEVHQLAVAGVVDDADRQPVSAAVARDTGQEAIQLSESIRYYKERERLDDDPDNVRHVGDRTFYLINGQWVDSRYRQNMKTIKVEFASGEYFKLLKEKPDLKKCLVLGRKMIICLDDTTAVVVE